MCKKHAWDWWTLDFALFGMDEPFVNTIDGFITKSRLQTTQDGKLVKEFDEKIMATEIVQILDVFLRNKLWYTGIQSPRFCKWPWSLNWSKWMIFEIDIPSQTLLDHSSKWKLDDYVKAHAKEKPGTTNWYLSQNFRAMKRASKWFIKMVLWGPNMAKKNSSVTSTMITLR